MTGILLIYIIARNKILYISWGYDTTALVFMIKYWEDDIIFLEM